MFIIIFPIENPKKHGSNYPMFRELPLFLAGDPQSSPWSSMTTGRLRCTGDAFEHELRRELELLAVREAWDSSTDQRSNE
jgi:hypothetical protein